MASPVVKCSWVADLKTGTFLANSRESVRVMGVVTALEVVSLDDRAKLSSLIMDATKSRDIEPKNEESKSQLSNAQSTTTNITAEDYFSVSIDDGTNSIAFWAPRRLIESSSGPIISAGATYDCILKLRQRCQEKGWFAETLIQIDDPIDEHLRWLELSHHDKAHSQGPSSRFRYSNLCHKSGYPRRRRNRVEVYRLIRLNSQLQVDQQQERKKQTPFRASNIQYKRTNLKRTIEQPLQPQHRRQGLKQFNSSKRRISFGIKNPKSAAPHSPAPTQPIVLEGLLLKDLVTVLQTTEQNVQDMIEELQLEGKIYQNERGEYLPL